MTAMVDASLSFLQGVPEDLLISLLHPLRKGLSKRSFFVYQHQHVTTDSVLQFTIETHQVHFLEERALSHWGSFTIWNSGKQRPKAI